MNGRIDILENTRSIPEDKKMYKKYTLASYLHNTYEEDFPLQIAIKTQTTNNARGTKIRRNKPEGDK